MNEKEFTRMAERLLTCPTAPFHEAGVRAVVEALCAEHGLASRRDRFGNVLVSLKTNPRPRPLVLAAHMDHPGFELLRALGPGRWLAQFNGGVPDSYFRGGQRLRLLPGAIPAVLGPRVVGQKRFEIHATRQAVAGLDARATPRFAVWELPDFALRGGHIHGRACDDLIGVAAVLATLVTLKRRRARVNVLGVISRAEEVGFLGALAAADAGSLPRRALVISLETSRELPPVKMGRGVILRVGDRTSVFDSTGMRFLAEVAARWQAREPKFLFQRALMFGGTCEATAYQELGFQCTGVCVALGNYHNCGPRNRLAAEYVSQADALGMVALLVQAARQMPAYERLTGRLSTRLRKLLHEGRRKLAARP